MDGTESDETVIEVRASESLSQVPQEDWDACACPESADGGPLAAVRTGDRIRLDVPGRKLELLVSADELAARMADLPPPPPVPERGYARLYDQHVTQADDGLDFDFLMAKPHE